MKTVYRTIIAAIAVILCVSGAQAAETETVLWQNYSPNGSTFTQTVSFNKDTQNIHAEIDLSGVTGELENLLSFGSNIGSWQGGCQLHLYYTKGSSTLRVDYLASSSTGSVQKDLTLSSTSTLIVDLKSDGLYLNNTLQSAYSSSVISNLLALTTMSVGSAEGDNRSHATYTKVSVITNGDDSGGGTTTTDRTFSMSWITNPGVVGQYEEAGHATFMPYATTEAMQADSTYEKPWITPTKADYLNLNGTWKFKYVAGTTSGPETPTASYYGTNVDDSSWDDIRVPCSWENAGFGTPVYCNEGRPWTDTWSSNSTTFTTYIGNSIYGVKDNDAAGFYRRTFTLPSGWGDKRVFLHFDGVYSCAYVWVNGKFVGYSEDSNMDAEFDVTAFVTADGDNQLSVCAYRWVDGSYLEQQDAWRLSGIHRDVYLYATPKTFVSNHVITADLNDAATSGSMKVVLTLDNRDGSTVSKTVNVKLLDADGSQVGATQTATFSNVSATTTDATVTFSGLTGLTAWSAETPYLYTVEVSQLNADGSEEMAFSTKYGFKTVKVSGNKVLVNGKRVFFKGVNIMDAHPLYGRAVDVETMLKDVTMMKRANINTVWTSHYPRQAKMYAMFDYYGLYVGDEGNVECHGDMGLSDYNLWQTAFLDRETRTVLRDRNHASIVFWSLGNECGAGTNCNLLASYKAVKALDSRPIHYETNSDGDASQSQSSSDLGSTMYPTIEDFKNETSGWGSNNKPLILCGYAHAMGQAMGNFKEYWDVMEGSDGIIGGLIWDWVDQAFYDPQKVKSGASLVSDNGFNYWVAGYDYNDVKKGANETVYMGNFMDNGILTPDRKWTSKLTEVKHVHQFVGFGSSLDGTTLTLKNKYNFTNLNEFDVVYQLLKDGRLVETGKAQAPSVEPASTKDYPTGTLSLPFSTSYDSGSEYVLHVSVCLREDKPWASAGYPVADYEYVLQDRSSLSEPSTSGSLTVNSSNRTVSGTVDGKAFEMTFGSDGSISKWTYSGVSLIDATPVYNNFRNNDNERGNVTGTWGNYVWDSSTLTSGTSTTSIKSGLSQSGSNATIALNGTNSKCNFTIAYTIYPNAVVDMIVTLSPRTSGLRRVGLLMGFPGGFEDVDYYGRGPWSNYVDRKTGSYLGRYTTTVDDLYEEFTHPQTNGDHQDLRELTLTNKDKGVKLNVQTEGKVAFSLSHYDDESNLNHLTFANKYHCYDMTKQSRIYAHFDYWQRGLGNGSCGADKCLSKYECPSSGTCTYTLRFTPSTAE